MPTVPRRKRRRRLIILTARTENDAGIAALMSVEPLLVKYENNETLTTEEAAVLTTLDGFYDGIDSNDSLAFEACTATIDAGAIADGIEAINNSIDDWKNA